MPSRPSRRSWPRPAPTPGPKWSGPSARSSTATDQALKELAETSANLAVDLAGKIVAAKLTAAGPRPADRRGDGQLSQGRPSGELNGERRVLESRVTSRSRGEWRVTMEASAKPSSNGPNGAIDPGSQQIAAVYAKAFVGAAQTAGDAEAVVAELDSLVHDVLDRFPRLQSVLESSFIKPDEKIAHARPDAAGRASQTVLVFSQGACPPRRLNCLRAIGRAARALFDQMRGRVRVDVTTAAPLTDALAARLAGQLRQHAGRRAGAGAARRSRADRRRRAPRRRHRLRRLDRHPIAAPPRADDRQECP